MATTARLRRVQLGTPTPPPLQVGAIIHGDRPQLECWLVHYWQKLQLPSAELSLLALTQDRQEYMRWTGKRLNLMALGCYCYIPVAPSVLKPSMLFAGEKLPQHRHLIFIEPTMQAASIEVTVAHELIHLSDRVQGNPRRHHHHGYDSIAADEAAITGYAVEDLRKLLHEESNKREHMRRERRPIRYMYQCSHCGKLYPRTRKYSLQISCSSCDKHYNPQFSLQLLPSLPVEGE
jgi:predicted SprT family Zn-dependent metalloprotease